MKSISYFTVLLVAFIGLVGCEGDYRQEASGPFSDVVVVMEPSDWEGELGETVRNTWGQAIETLPNIEPMFDLRHRHFNSNEELESIKRNRNVIIAAPIGDTTNTSELISALLSDDVENRVRSGDAFAFPLDNYWFRNQWTMILTSTDDSTLSRMIRDSEKRLTASLLDRELDRWTWDIYERGEQTALADSLMENNGWMIRVQHDWVRSIDTTWTQNGAENHMMTMRRPLVENDRWLWAWWRGGVEDASFIDTDWINAKRDSLMEEWIRGTRPESYTETDYRRAVETDTLTVDGHAAWETRGVWRMTGDAMAGPFVNLTVHDDETGRLFMLEFAQFAPKYNKRRFVRQFRAMLRTFRTDSAWTEQPQPTAGN